jgi:hypothetical protein
MSRCSGSSLQDKLERVILPMYYSHPETYAIALNGSFFNPRCDPNPLWPRLGECAPLLSRCRDKSARPELFQEFRPRQHHDASF